MKAVRHAAEYALVSLTMRLARVLPWGVVRAMGSGLGFLFYAFDRRHRRIALQNLAAAFPRKPDAERQALVRQVFGHFGRLLFELLKFSTLSQRRGAGQGRVRGRRADPRGARARARACSSSPATSATGRCTPSPTPRRSRRSACWRARSTTRGCTTCSSGCAARPGNYVIYRHGALRRVLKALERQRRRGAC